MTLAMTVVSPEGVWQSTDFMLVGNSGAAVSTHSIKQLVLSWLPDTSAIVSYAGLGRVFGLGDLSDWLNKRLRGIPLTPRETLERIRVQATQDLPSAHQFFLLSGWEGSRPWMGLITNVDPITPDFLQHPPRKEFSLDTEFVAEPHWLGVGAGQAIPRDMTSSFLEFVRTGLPSCSPREVMVRLAAMNRAAAESGHQFSGGITPACMVTYMPPGGLPLQQECFNWDENHGPRPHGTPLLANGIDVALMMENILKLAPKAMRGDLSDAEFDSEHDNIARLAVRPPSGAVETIQGRSCGTVINRFSDPVPDQQQPPAHDERRNSGQGPSPSIL